MANIPLEKTEITLDDLLRTTRQVEVINGEMIEMATAGVAHHLIGGNVYRHLDPFVVARGIGVVFFDGLTYLMFSEAKRLKDSFVPDVSFIRLTNLLPNFDVSKPYPGVPDLAVEVVSPNDSAEVLQTKLRTYLEKGTEQVWIVYPSTKEVYQYRRDRGPEPRIYSGSQKMDVEDLFPGLELTTDMIFALPPWAVHEE
jgi:Uma2 family endonuclease